LTERFSTKANSFSDYHSPPCVKSFRIVRELPLAVKKAGGVRPVNDENMTAAMMWMAQRGETVIMFTLA
jgi:hypothetical protein